MAETKNIDEIASIISNKIFRELKWDINLDYTDLNWACVEEKHNKTIKTHPTDVVFNYVDPYSSIMQYIQTDLKSYAKNTISPQKITNAVKSLAMQVECAAQSQEWAEYYRKGEADFDLHGLLFIYNNCGTYDTDLLSKISGLASKPKTLPSNSTLNIFSPKLIRFLMTVVEDIKGRRNIEEDEDDNFKWQHIPQKKKCGFYYPNKHTESAALDVKHPASLEMITSGMLLFSYQNEYFDKEVLNIYWDETVDSESYFIYLFEFIFNYQLLNIHTKIFVITPFSTASGKYFKIAKTTYKSQYAVSQNQKDRIDQIEYLNMDTIKTSIFPFQINNGDMVNRHLVKGE